MEPHKRPPWLTQPSASRDDQVHERTVKQEVKEEHEHGQTYSPGHASSRQLLPLQVVPISMTASQPHHVPTDVSAHAPLSHTPPFHRPQQSALRIPSRHRDAPHLWHSTPSPNSMSAPVVKVPALAGATPAQPSGSPSNFEIGRRISKSSLSFILDDEFSNECGASGSSALSSDDDDERMSDALPQPPVFVTSAAIKASTTQDECATPASAATTSKSTKGRRRKASRPPSRVCKHEGCEQYVVDQGLCVRHGGGKRCMTEGCTSRAKHQGRCWKHGGSTACKVPNCVNRAKSRGFCWSHGGGTKCKSPACDKIAISNGLCWAHGGGKRCLVEGCMRQAYERTQNFCNNHYQELFEQHQTAEEETKARSDSRDMDTDVSER